MGGSFGNHQDIEEYSLRSASESESKRLKRCLRSALAAQTRHQKKTGKFYRNTGELDVDDECQGFSLSQKRSDQGLEIMAQFNENDSTVRWTINQDGVIEEHLDGEEMEDLEF
jgi:hypothetical protein